MLESWERTVRLCYDWLIDQALKWSNALQGFDLKDWAAVATVLWIIYQFNERRKLNERNIEKYLDRQLDDKNRNLVDEREEFLSRFDIEPASSRFARLARKLFAKVQRLVSLALRILRLQFARPSASHAMMLFDGGDKAAAQSEFNKLADDLLEKARLYSKHARAKRTEATNALIYTGRVAAMRDDAEATIAAFKRALKLRDGDADARKFIGEQYRAARDFDGALEQFDKMIEIAERKNDQATLAEGFRLKGEVFRDKGEIGNARNAIKRSLEIERERLSYGGIAKTEEQLGDLYALRDHSFGAARRAYLASIANYRLADDARAVRGVRRKLAKLRTEDTILSRTIESLARLMLRAAKRLRVQVRTT